MTRGGKPALGARRRRQLLRAACCILHCRNELVSVGHAFALTAEPSRHRFQALRAVSGDNASYPAAYIVGYIPEEDKEDLVEALYVAGYASVQSLDESSSSVHQYSYSKATGMLKLIREPGDNDKRILSPPRWVPMVRGEENVLVANGWSFLDPDENDPLSAFDVDAANLEGQYKPKWGDAQGDTAADGPALRPISSLGFSLRQLSLDSVQKEAVQLQDLSKSVLLEGATDPPQRKQTHNGYNFSGSASQSDIESGVFVCAIGGLPLFTTIDLSPTTASSGWLSFSRPVSDDHLVLVEPDANSLDQRIEVLCAKTRCHLGHYFGKGNGYCINASALNFIAASKTTTTTTTTRPHDDIASKRQSLDLFSVALPVSWRALEARENDWPSLRLVQNTCHNVAFTETLVFGAGCFWHVEFAFRRLPGVVSTETGYAGGSWASPTYEDVCHKETGHAEVVRVTFDPTMLNPRILIDCFLALHDPTKIRALGKHAQGTGQYRSCIFVTGAKMERTAREALDDCQHQLKKDLSTQLHTMDACMDSWFWSAEERHQRHDEKGLTAEKNDLSTLATTEWLRVYGKRKETIWGSSETLSALTSM